MSSRNRLAIAGALMLVGGQSVGAYVDDTVRAIGVCVVLWLIYFALVEPIAQAGDKWLELRRRRND